MQSSNFRIFVLFVSLLFIVSCGGGGGGGGRSDNQLTDEESEVEESDDAVMGSTCSETITSQSNTEIVLKNSASYCDYFVESEVKLENVDVTIEPGTVIVFGEKSELEIDGGTFEAIGTSGQPILMRGEVQSAGYWYDIMISDMEDVNMEYTSIQDGGGVRGFFNVWLTSSSARLVNVEVSNSGSSGMWLSQGDDETLREFSKNRFYNNRDHGLVLSVPPEAIDKLDRTTDFSGKDQPNGTNRIKIEGLHLGQGEQLELPTNLNGVLYFTNTIVLNDNGTPDLTNIAKLTINSGARIEFSYRGSIYVRSGTLEIIGTESDPAILTGVLGGDNEIKFFGISAYGSNSNFRNDQSTVVMENVLINHGGLPDNNESEEPGAIQVGGDARVSLTNVTISNAVGVGISCHDFSSKTFSPENLTIDNVKFSNNGSVDLDPYCGK